MGESAGRKPQTTTLIQNTTKAKAVCFRGWMVLPQWYTGHHPKDYPVQRVRLATPIKVRWLLTASSATPAWKWQKAF